MNYDYCPKSLLAMLLSVEGLYFKRPIQCLASSKILTPTPSPPGECVPPAFGAGGGQTRWVERGWGVNILEDVRHCSVFYIRKKYFVLLSHVKMLGRCPQSLTLLCLRGLRALARESSLLQSSCQREGTPFRNLEKKAKANGQSKVYHYLPLCVYC
jgi:hypothetical protein